MIFAGFGAGAGGGGVGLASWMLAVTGLGDSIALVGDGEIGWGGAT